MSVVKDIDFDRKLDEVGLIALPYLVHAFEPFRTELAHQMETLVHSYLRKDVGGTYTQIEASIDRVLDMIEEYRIGSLPSQENIQTIDMYAAKIQNQEDRVKQLSARLDAHIKSHEKRPKVVREPMPEPAAAVVIQPVAPVSAPVPVVAPVVAVTTDERFEVVKEIITQTGNVSYKDLMSRFSIPKRAAQTFLTGLIATGLLKNVGNRRVPRYVVNVVNVVNEEVNVVNVNPVDNPAKKDEVAAVKEILGERNPEYIKNSDIQVILKERFHYTACDTKTAPETVAYLQSRTSQILNQLVVDGWIVREGKSRATRYKLNFATYG